MVVVVGWVATVTPRASAVAADSGRIQPLGVGSVGPGGVVEPTEVGLVSREGASRPGGEDAVLDICVLNPGMGNLRSVCRSWERAGARVRVAAHRREVGQPDALVFPGQGGMKNLLAELRARELDDAVREWIAADRPYFGICLGLQALFEWCEESEGPGLGIFGGRVPRFRLPAAFKVPHMGWNTLEAAPGEALPGAWWAGAQAYFVHSYYAEPTEEKLVWSWTEYGGTRFCSAIRRGNCYAVQFHPEKSQGVGLQIQTAFLSLLQSSKT